jgi:hypothetical protein
MAKDILKEAIADAKAVREVALANAKAALEEAFTPRLQSMLSAKLSEELEEDTLEETEGMEPKEDMEEIMEPMDETKDEKDLDETYMDESMDEELDEEVNLEEILAELELEESEIAEVKKDDDLDETRTSSQADYEDSTDYSGTQRGKTNATGVSKLDEKDEDLDEAKEEIDEEEKIDEMEVIAKAETANRTGYKAEYVHEDKEFDLDALLEEINNLDEEEESVDEIGGALKRIGGAIFNKLRKVGQDLMLVSGDDTFDKNASPADYKRMSYPMKNPSEESQNYSGVEEVEQWMNKYYLEKLNNSDWGGNDEYAQSWAKMDDNQKAEFVKNEVQRIHSRQLDYWKTDVKSWGGGDKVAAEMAEIQKELDETKAALEVKTSELNEVNLLNSKLLYVNRIFKANTLSESQKLRVVETLDNASNVKEAKLIYETIKDTFTISKEKKRTPKRSIKENFGMASKAAGTSTAPKKEVISESNDMVARFKKLANIKINQ